MRSLGIQSKQERERRAKAEQISTWKTLEMGQKSRSEKCEEAKTSEKKDNFSDLCSAKFVMFSELSGIELAFETFGSMLET